MNTEIAQLLALHRAAERFGVALKPELLRTLRQTMPQGAIPLEPRVTSSGPAHHTLNEIELAQRGIVQIGRFSQKSHQKDGTYD